MTPAQFHAAYRSTADQVTVGTGIDPIALLAQWANETEWGNVVIGNNLGNIRCSPTTFCSYATLDNFAQAAIGVWHQTAFINNAFPNGFEPFRAAAASGAGIVAIVASPWSSGHYGGSLEAFYSPLKEFELTPEQDVTLRKIIAGVQAINFALFYGQGTANSDPSGYASKDVDGRLAAALQPVLDAIAKIPSSGGGIEPLEPIEPKTITLNIPSVPGTATGTIS